MTEFKVIGILDADTIIVSPEWKINLKDGSSLQGSKLRVHGYNPPSGNRYAYELTKRKLEALVLNKYVSLKNPYFLPKNENELAPIACQVILNDVDISYYFSDLNQIQRRDWNR